MTQLRFTRGDKFVREWQVDADKAITGSTLRMMFRPSLGEAPVISLSLALGNIVISVDTSGNHKFLTTIVAADTADTSIFSTTDETPLVWDIELIYSDGDGPFTIASGSCTIVPDVTR